MGSQLSQLHRPLLHPGCTQLHSRDGLSWPGAQGLLCTELHCHSLCVLTGMCQRYLFSIIIAHARQGQGQGVSFSSGDPDTCPGAQAGPCRQQGRTLQFTSWGLYIIFLPAPHHIQLLLPPPVPPRKTPGAGSPFPGGWGLRTAATRVPPGMAPQEPAVLNFPLTSGCIPGPCSFLWHPGHFPLALLRGSVLPRVRNLPGIIIAICWLTCGQDKNI